VNQRTDELADYFDRVSGSFDAIYTGEKSRIGRLWDRLTRSNIHYRLNHTLRAVAPVAGKRVLDVGCGPGRYAVALASSGAEEVVGLDVSPRMVELARSLAERSGLSSRCRFSQQDVLMHRADEPYDDVVAQGFFDYVLDAEPVFTRLRSLCRSTLVASFPWRYAGRVLPRKAWLSYRGCAVRFFTQQEIMRLCRNAHFRCKSLERRGPIFLLVAESESREPDKRAN
jgi:2-polyprenyl-3-methyl-5-hydroxy-6-metoxy-1,4-benzoquinol methylase